MPNELTGQIEAPPEIIVQLAGSGPPGPPGEPGKDGDATAVAMAFEVSEEGHLLLHYEGDAPGYYINEAGHLCLAVD